MTTTQIPTSHETTLTTWEIDPSHTEIGFSVKHLMISTVRGRFSGVKGSVFLDSQDVSRSSAEVEIDASTIDTREEKRDGHLRSADFFDVEKYPAITFRSRRIESLGGNRFRVTGDLTIRDVTREIVLDATEEGRGRDPWGGERVGFTATGKIDRREFGLTWNQALEAGGVMVSNEIKLSIEAQAVKVNK
jgi:polyisoprenoid-binding protein YceI